jgi:hypothetical protein
VWLAFGKKALRAHGNKLLRAVLLKRRTKLSKNQRTALYRLPFGVVALSVFAIGMIALSPAPASAETPGRHPHYLHARSDLRTAQLLLRVHDEPNVMAHIHAVDGEIDAAVREIDRAAVLDHKDMEDHPRFDARLDRPGRFRQAMGLLASARRDIGMEEDNPRAIAWRDVAFRHIDEAINQLRRAARDLHMDHLEGF